MECWFSLPSYNHWTILSLIQHLVYTSVRISLIDKNCISSVHFSSVTQSCLTLCDPMNCSTPGLPVHHQLPEFTQTHVHRVGDGQGGLECCDSWGREESDTTERLNWMQDVNNREDWFAAVHGVANRHTWLSDWTEVNWNSEFSNVTEYKSIHRNHLHYYT